jgi:HAMP domain-containing protein
MTTTSPRTAYTSYPPGAPPTQRRLRNYLLDPSFQLKYTGMVAAVAFCVSSVLGFVAWRHSTETTRMMTLNNVSQADNINDAVISRLEADADAYDMRLAFAIGGGVLLLTFAIGITGIFVTHRLVGPAYKLRILMKEVQRGRLRVVGRLRKGDELKEVFDAFECMVDSLRARQADEIRILEDAIERAKGAGSPSAVVDDLTALQSQMRSELE